MASGPSFQRSFSTRQEGFTDLFGAPAATRRFGPFVVATVGSAPGQESPQRTAESIVEDARAEARAVVEQAREEACRLTEETIAAVREEQTSAFAGATRSLLGSLEGEWAMALQRLELEGAGLVCEIVRRLLAEHFEAEPEAIVPLVREALQKVAESARVQVVIAPCHEEQLRHAHHELAAVLAEEARLEVVVEAGAAPYGCVVHGDHGSIDARLEGRLSAVEQVINETITGQQAA
jgi:flagellar assembly protein FliH